LDIRIRADRRQGSIRQEITGHPGLVPALACAPAGLVPYPQRRQARGWRGPARERRSSEVDNLSFGGDGDARVGAEAGRERVEFAIGPR
jgi:hypothetical protein